MPQPSNLHTALRAALAHHQAGRYAQAEALYRQVLAAAPEHGDAWHLLGLLAHQQGEPEVALQRIQRAIQIKPGDAGYRVNLAEPLLALGRTEEAIASLRRAIGLEPDLAVAHANLANVLYEQDRHDEALEACQEALRRDPDSAPAWNTYGNLKEAAGGHGEAQRAYRMALNRDPGFARARANLAISLERCEDFAGAQAAYEEALRGDPAFADAHWNYALMLLKTGQFERGWQEYEWRWRVPKLAKPPRGFTQPLWEGRGGQDLQGRSVLMHAEQGFGDAIQFVRYAPLLARRGARVFLHCPRELSRLFRSARGVDSVIPDGEAVPETDFQVPFMSLPRAFGTRLETIPDETPYLWADPEATRGWRARLESLGVGSKGLRVGLVWAGRPTPGGYNAGRSMRLSDLTPLFGIPGVSFVGLQKGPGREQIEACPYPLPDLGAEVEDFADLAAILESVDLLVSIDTAAAHLAGALGRPAWILVPRPPAFQWMTGRTDSPWYPSLRLFRQEAEGDWSRPIQDLAQALGSLAMAERSRFCLDD